MTRGILGAKTIAQMVPEFLYPLPDWGHDVLGLAPGVACYLFGGFPKLGVPFWGSP